MRKECAEIRIKGIVQGVGFRPFVYRLATELGLEGDVSNTEEGVIVRISAEKAFIERFCRLIKAKCPPLAKIDGMETRPAPFQDFNDFRIVKSKKCGKVTTQISPDIATCRDCLREILDPSDRRFGYAFTNCTNCGPRYSIIKALPYDRPNTSMAPFVMCKKCQAEYDNPLDRRFHAQPNACPECGPKLFFTDPSGRKIPGNPLKNAVDFIKSEGIVAVKGLGGFHLACSALSDTAVSALRQRKNRPFKPFAVMARDIYAAKRLARIDRHAEKLLASFQAPIVLVPKREESSLSPLVAPNISDVGIMLPYTPLHHLLLRTQGCPEALVMTSGNPKDEPLCTANQEALDRLSRFVDGFVMHNRDIFTGVDDSVARTFSDGHFFIRRSRGYAPAPLSFPLRAKGILAAGAELKNTFCLIKDHKAYPSQHMGNLVTKQSYDFYRKNIRHLANLLEMEPKLVACDLHPDYLSTRFAIESGLRVVQVQHHFAHAASVMAEHHLKGPVIAVCLDGTGLGTDETVWGGEVLMCTNRDFERRARLKPFPLPGGDACARSPWRTALATLISAYGNDAPNPDHIIQYAGEQNVRFIRSMIQKSVNCPLTSSLGRLFDAACALCSICMENSYEAQAAMEMESLCASVLKDRCITETESFSYFFKDKETVRQAAGLMELDWGLLWRTYMESRDCCPEDFSLLFHSFVVAGFSRIADILFEETGIKQVVLSGGCLQNRILAQGFLDFFTKKGMKCYLNRKVPSNDGGLSLGQAYIAACLSGE